MVLTRGVFDDNNHNNKSGSGKGGACPKTRGIIAIQYRWRIWRMEDTPVDMANRICCLNLCYRCDVPNDSGRMEFARLYYHRPTRPVVEIVTTEHLK